MCNLITPSTFLQQRLLLEEKSTKAREAEQAAREIEQHQKTALAVMEAAMRAARRLNEAHAPFAGGELVDCILSDNTPLGKQAAWMLRQDKYALVITSTMDVHITTWTRDGFIALTAEEFTSLEEYVLSGMLDDLEAIEKVESEPKWQSVV
jgi:hypothetical protein